MNKTSHSLFAATVTAFGLALCCTSAYASGAALGDILYFEDFEQFDAADGHAPLAAQSDWTTEREESLLVVSENAIQGQSGRFTSLYIDPVGTFAMVSPTFGSAFGKLEMDIALSEQFAGRQLMLYDTESQFLNARIQFGGANVGFAARGQGVIQVGQFVPETSVHEFVVTEATWAPDEIMRIGVEVTPGGVLRVFKNGELIFSGVETNRAIFGKSGRVGQFFITNVGDGVEPGEPDGSGSTVTIDNIVFRAPACPADLIGDGVVGAADLALLLSAWQACGPNQPCPGDMDGDGNVDARDLALLLSYWGPCPE